MGSFLSALSPNLSPLPEKQSLLTDHKSFLLQNQWSLLVLARQLKSKAVDAALALVAFTKVNLSPYAYANFDDSAFIVLEASASLLPENCYTSRGGFSDQEHTRAGRPPKQGLNGGQGGLHSTEGGSYSYKDQRHNQKQPQQQRLQQILQRPSEAIFYFEQLIEQLIEQQFALRVPRQPGGNNTQVDAFIVGQLAIQHQRLLRGI